MSDPYSIRCPRCRATKGCFCLDVSDSTGGAALASRIISAMPFFTGLTEWLVKPHPERIAAAGEDAPQAADEEYDHECGSTCKDDGCVCPCHDSDAACEHPHVGTSLREQLEGAATADKPMVFESPVDGSIWRFHTQDQLYFIHEHVKFAFSRLESQLEAMRVSRDELLKEIKNVRGYLIDTGKLAAAVNRAEVK